MFKATLFSILLLFSGHLFATEVGDICDACNPDQKRNAAIAEAVVNNLARVGVDVYILDFHTPVLTKYFVIENGGIDPLGPIPPGQQSRLDDRLTHESVILDQTRISTRSGTTYSIVELVPTPEYLTAFDDLEGAVSRLAEQGVFIVNSSATVSEDLDRAILEAESSERPVTINNAFYIPPGLGFDSAFDVLDIPSRTRRIGVLAIAANQMIADALKAASTLTRVFTFLGDEIDIEHLHFEFIFSDGSRGLWRFNNFNLLDATGEFIDSDLNDIPVTAEDVPNVSSEFFSTGIGGGESSANFQNTRDRVISLGFSATGAGGGGDCIWQCGPTSCTLTCRLE